MLLARIPSRLVIAILACGIALGVATSALSGDADSPPSKGSEVSPDDDGAAQVRPALECRLERCDEARQRAALWRHYDFRRRPDLLTRKMSRNPLAADLWEAKIQNTSGRDFLIYAYDPAKPFATYIEMWNSTGDSVKYPVGEDSGIRRLGPHPGLTPIVTLKPNQAVTQLKGLWNVIKIENMPKPGRYTARMVSWFFRAPDGADCNVESATVALTITEEDIREYRNVLTAPNYPWPFWYEETKKETKR